MFPTYRNDQSYHGPPTATYKLDLSTDPGVVGGVWQPSSVGKPAFRMFMLAESGTVGIKAIDDPSAVVSPPLPAGTWIPIIGDQFTTAGTIDEIWVGW